ncbi:hypothetical protein PR048_016939 [Dryococelus australis]|uniref:Uncharacterized protein n=1 Tax=Dryococelus australis TaxID=614101 RepID=A0ABQ9H866_9NEOP|nr:hypothetical protein PR048_016939 [Dryococelus australis]
MRTVEYGRKKNPSIRRSSDEKILEQMKKTFAGCTERSIKVQIPTILPKDWSMSIIQKEFPAAIN